MPRNKILHWVIFLAVILQLASCIFTGQIYLPELRF